MIKYEFNYTILSSSHRDEDLNSDFDKFESYLIRQDKKYCPICKELHMITHLIAGNLIVLFYNNTNNIIKIF